MVKKNIKAILFDVDGTLFDRDLAQKMTVKGIVRKFPHAFNMMEMKRVEEAFMESDRLTVADFEAGTPSERLREKRSLIFLDLLGLPKELAGDITEVYVQDYPNINAPVIGAITAVRELNQHYLVGVISNGLPDVQYRKLETMGLRDLFSCIVLSEEFGHRKPDQKIFHHALMQMHMQPQDCLYVGDSYANDVVGAKNAGMHTCWLNPESMKPLDAAKLPDLEIRTLIELPALLEHF